LTAPPPRVIPSPQIQHHCEEAVAKPELGTKRVCPTTGRKFYDLNKDPIVSPYSGESFPRSVFEPQVRGRVAEKARVVKDEVEIEAESPEDVEIITLEEADEDTAGRKVVKPVVDPDDIEDEIVADDDDDEDDAFLADDEDADDDVADLIEGDLKGDEEA
jgi:uncharacterized protein (TIGR02300 family)